MLVCTRFLAAWMVFIGAVLSAQPMSGDDMQFKAGDRVVTTERVDVQAAQGKVATLQPGVPLTIADVRQGWVGVTAEQNGQKIAGWVRPKSLAPAGGAKEPKASSATGGPPVAGAGTAKEPGPFEQGYAAHLKGQFVEAIAGYDEAIRLDPKHARAYNNRGLVYQAKGDLNRAIANFSEAIRLTPAVSSVYVNRGNAYAKRGDRDQAIADYGEAIRLDPQSAAQAYKLRAAVYTAKGLKDKAAADLAQASKTYKPRYDTIAHKALKIELEVKSQDYAPNYELLDSIIDEAKAKIKVKSSYSEKEATEVLKIIDDILLQRRFMAVDQGLLCDALVPQKVTSTMISSIDPKAVRFKLRVGETVNFAHDFSNVLIYVAIGEVLGLPIRGVSVPNHAFVRWCMTDTTHVNWDTTGGAVKPDSEYVAMQHISDASIKNGIYLSNLSPNEMLAGVFCDVGAVWSGLWVGLENEYRNKDEVTRFAKAIASLTKAIELNAKAYDAYVQRGRCFTVMGAYDKALLDGAQAISLAPEQPGGYFSRGITYIARCDDKRVARDLDKLYADSKKAIADFDKLIELNPQVPMPYYFRGLAWSRCREWDPAIKDFSKAIELAPNFLGAYQVRAQLWDVMGKRDKAQADREKVKALQRPR
jgi:tetratricopeptide (TPR) repeat protein